MAEPLLDIHGLPGHLIRRLNQIAVAQFMEKMGEIAVDLTPVQYSALCAVKSHPGIDQASIAGLIAYDRATLGKVIDRLEAKGLVSRKVSPQDRRARVVKLTKSGQELLQQVHPVVRAAQGDILTGLDNVEQAQFIALMQKTIQIGNESSRAPQRELGETG
ncbi:MarR family transcriptional regulator [Pseudophaeobacter sp.]|uniref:MarR family winged helix-turn-helix transcriptional regulator n=1 Tax=Pseudophaeobacter sp. TaxID=1971739 RepID=UPI00329A0D0F